MTLLPPVSPLHVTATDVVANADLVVFLLVGVFAGAHCLGMCGPLVGFYSDRMTQQRSTDRRDHLSLFEVRQHALFNGGRVVGYAVVGAFFGLLGGTVFATVDVLAPIGDGLRAATGLLVGGLVMAGGLGYLVRGTGVSLLESLPVISPAFRWVNSLLTRHVDGLAGSPGIVALGTVHAALPCPIIYPAYLYAFAIGNPLRGGLSLAVLGLGTFPTLFAFGTALGSLNTRQRGALHRVLGVTFVGLGYILVSHGLTLLGIAVPHVEIPYYQPLTPP